MPLGFVRCGPLLGLHLPREMLRPPARGTRLVRLALDAGHLETGSLLLRGEVFAKGRLQNPLLHHIGGCKVQVASSHSALAEGCVCVGCCVHHLGFHDAPAAPRFVQRYDPTPVAHPAEGKAHQTTVMNACDAYFNPLIQIHASLCATKQ